MTVSLESKLCSVCQKPMYEKDIRGVTVDICDQHGIWLDRGELDHLAKEFRKDGFGDAFESGMRKVFTGINH